MAFKTVSKTTPSTTSGAGLDLLNENLTVTAGVAVGGVTAVAALGVATAAAPAVVVNGALLSGLLVYSGHKNYQGEYLLPFLYDEDEKAAYKARAEKRRDKQEAKRAAKALEEAPAVAV